MRCAGGWGPGPWVLGGLLLGSFGCGGSPPEPATAEAASEASAPPQTEAAEAEPEPEPAAASEAPAAETEANDSPREGEAEPKEARTKEVIHGVVQRARQTFRACYEKSLEQHPGARGDLTIRFTVDPQGKVKSAEVNPERTTLNFKELHTCAIDAMLALQFPPSSRGFESKVDYPFNFNP